MRLLLPDTALAPRIVRYLRQNAEHFSATAPPRPHAFYDEAYWRERLQEAARNVREGTALSVYLSLRGDREGAIIGDMTLSDIVRGPFQAAYLGYGIDLMHQGRGLMFEALQALIHHAFETMRLHRIMANYIPTNERSARLLRRLGFTPEGYARDYLFIAGAWRDHVLTAILNPMGDHPSAPNAAPTSRDNPPAGRAISDQRFDGPEFTVRYDQRRRRSFEH